MAAVVSHINNPIPRSLETEHDANEDEDDTRGGTEEEIAKQPCKGPRR